MPPSTRTRLISLLLLSISSTFAVQLHLTFPNCTVPAFNWTINHDKKNPCEVAAALEAACRGDSAWVIQPIPPNMAYGGPDAGAGNKCRCSSVVYSLLSACSLCQGGSVNPWIPYQVNCALKDVTNQSFNVSFPDGYNVPTWAYLDFNETSSFNPGAALQVASLNQPDVTQSNETSTPSDSDPGSNPNSNSSSHSASKAGPIAGGVVGAVALVCIVAGVAFYLFRRRKQRGKSYNPVFVDLTADPKPAYLIPTPYYPPGTRGDDGTAMRLYNPSDPSTFPEAVSASGNSVVSGHQHRHTLSNSTFNSGATSPAPSLPNMPAPTVTSGRSIVYKGFPEV